MKVWWISCLKFTVAVETSNGIITKAAPIVHKFNGQPLENLLRWARGIGGLRYQEL